MIEVRVSALAVDPSNGTPIVILKDLQNDRAIPIWVGIFEASAIAMELEGVTVPRPLTHDLFFNAIKLMGATISRVEIYDLRQNTFYSNICLRDNMGKEIIVDARPSDGIALALRAKAPIFVAEKVIKASSDIDLGGHLSREDIEKMQEEKIKEFLEGLSPEEFGKYKM